MDKLNMHSPDLTERNIDRIAGLFPSVMTERLDDDGNAVRAIDFDLLRQELSDHVVEGPQERYQLDWPGKRAALFAANAPIAKTLRPVREQSVNFDTTKNLFIEGDNLVALKLLQEPYLGKVKLIYIDPPYNTGNDLVYDDDFAETASEYLRRSQQVDQLGVRLVANTESNGRFHSDWLSMMLPRLKLCRNLLTEDGLLFISIDQNEVANLVLMCASVFGERNILGTIAVVNNLKGRSDDKHFATAHEYFLAIARSETSAAIAGFEPGDSYRAEFKFSDSISRFKEVGLRKTGKNSRRADRPNMFYPIYVDPGTATLSLSNDPGTIEILPLDSEGKEGCWRWGRDTFEAKSSTELTARIVNNKWNVYVKMRDTVDGAQRTVRPKSIWIDPKYDSGSGKREIKELFDGASVFDNPKPVAFLRDLLTVGTTTDSIVLDLFGGSGSLAQAVLDKNASDGGARRFISVQIEERVDNDSEAVEAGFSNIAEISIDRFRRATAKVESRTGASHLDLPDCGFRVLKVDTTNSADTLRTPEELSPDQLDLHTSSFKPDRTAEDLLFQILLEWALELTVPVTTMPIDGEEVFVVDDGALIADFRKDASIGAIRAIASRKPLRAVFRDSSFPTDADRINAEQIFAEASPSTDIKVI